MTGQKQYAPPHLHQMGIKNTLLKHMYKEMHDIHEPLMVTIVLKTIDDLSGMNV